MTPLQQKLFENIASTGRIDKQLFEQEIKKYDKVMNNFSLLLLELGQVISEAGGNPNHIISQINDGTISSFELLELFSKNDIGFVYKK